MTAIFDKGKQFFEVVNLIKNARYNAIKSVNTELINLYWDVGKYITEKVHDSQWGQGVVKELSEYISKTEPELRGFSDKNLWRMKQFYEVYKDSPKLSPLVRELSWTHNLMIFSRCKSNEEMEFYLRISIKEMYSKRELDRQISSGVYERTMLGNKSLPASVKNTFPNALNTFKDSYSFEFLKLSDEHGESDLQKGLLGQLKTFILEIGRDFLFVGEEYKVQVGNSDFFIDLLFYHRSLQCLVAFELKADKFRPEHLGQLNFYLEALDRDVKKPSENPSIGVLLCKDKDSEVVEYALGRTLQPTLIAEYKIQLPDKKLLQQKLHEMFHEK